jgi:hypothetical protein
MASCLAMTDWNRGKRKENREKKKEKRKKKKEKRE